MLNDYKQYLYVKNLFSISLLKYAKKNYSAVAN